MPRRVRRSRRIARQRRWRWRRRLLAPALIAGALCLQAVIYTRLSTRREPARNPDAALPAAHEAEPLARAAFPGRLGRPVYKLSVIPGGAYSPEELKQALDADEVAARHYAVFQRASLRTEPSPFVQPVYLSYRVGDAVFWTARPVALAPHETLLTDGANFARVRCGNRVAVTPQSPVQGASPAPEVFEDTDAPAPEPAAANRDEPLLAAEVFPQFPPETPWEIAGLAPAPIGDSQRDDRDPLNVQFPIDPSPIPPLVCWSTASPPGASAGSTRNPPPCTPLGWPRYDPESIQPESPPETPIPEPGSLALTLGGLGAAIAIRHLARPKRTL